jgi:hypothetical protein
MDMMPRLLPNELNELIDPDGGFLCLSSHWRPKPGDPDPEMPGEKMSMASYIPCAPVEPCLCGSGLPYRRCCRPKPDWQPICRNPGGQGYSLVKPQSATFRGVDRAAIHGKLAADPRFYCTVDEAEKGFYLFWGNPPVRDQYGILGFGDIELEGDTLVASAMSDLRMRVVLDVLFEIAGSLLGTPQRHYTSMPTLHKADRRPAGHRVGSKQSRRRRKR